MEQAGLEREGRLLVRLAAPALDGVHQRGFLAADERARADADLQIEVEIRAQNALAQQPRLARLMNGVAQPLHGQRVLRAHVDIAVVCADGVAAQQHALDEAVGVALEDRAVHEGAGVALVGVADHVFLPLRRVHAGLPLDARGEARAAAPAQAAALDLPHHVGGRTGQRPRERRVAVAGDVGLQRGVFHLAAVAKRDAHLLAEKAHVPQVRDAALLLVIVEGAFLHDFAFQKMAAGDEGRTLRIQAGVEHAVGLDHHHRPRRAQADAARDHDLDALTQAQCLHGLLQRLPDRLTVAADAARAAAHQHPPLIGGLPALVGGLDLAEHLGRGDFRHTASPSLPGVYWARMCSRLSGLTRL